MDNLEELKAFFKKLKSYQNRQRKRDRDSWSEAKGRSLNTLRMELQRYHARLRDIISKYGGEAVLPIIGREYEVFSLALGSLNMRHNEFTALDGAISLVNRAIAKLESTPITDLEPREIKPIESPKAFIAHGGDSPALRKLKSFLEALGVQPLIVEEQPSEGRSVADNVDWYARQADCGIILATKGDIDGRTGGFIPRGNVLIEIGKLQELFPDRIIYLLQAGAKFPTNISEKVRERFTPQSMDNAFIKIASELKKFGILKAIKPQKGASS